MTIGCWGSTMPKFRRLKVPMIMGGILISCTRLSSSWLPLCSTRPRAWRQDHGGQSPSESRIWYAHRYAKSHPLHQKVYKSADHAEISTFGRLQHVKHVRHTSNTAQWRFFKYVKHIFGDFLVRFRHNSAKSTIGRCVKLLMNACRCSHFLHNSCSRAK